MCSLLNGSTNIIYGAAFVALLLLGSDCISATNERKDKEHTQSSSINRDRKQQTENPKPPAETGEKTAVSNTAHRAVSDDNIIEAKYTMFELILWGNSLSTECYSRIPDCVLKLFHHRSSPDGEVVLCDNRRIFPEPEDIVDVLKVLILKGYFGSASDYEGIGENQGVFAPDGVLSDNVGNSGFSKTFFQSLERGFLIKEDSLRKAILSIAVSYAFSDDNTKKSYAEFTAEFVTAYGFRKK